MEDDGFNCLFDAVITRQPRLDCNFLKILEGNSPEYYYRCYSITDTPQNMLHVRKMPSLILLNDFLRTKTFLIWCTC